MKTKFRLLCVLVCLTMAVNAQKPFFFDKEGMKIVMADKNAKGKVTGFTESKVTSLKGDPANCTISYECMVTDDKNKPLLTQPMTMTITIKEGVVTFDPSSMVGKIVEGMQVSGDNLVLPATTKGGDQLKDYTVTVAIGPIKTTAAYSNVRATGEETVTISGNNIDCVIVESDVSSKVMGFKQQMKQKVWYGRGIGPVKTETYSNKGKLMTSQEITEITY